MGVRQWVHCLRKLEFRMGLKCLFFVVITISPLTLALNSFLIVMNIFYYFHLSSFHQTAILLFMIWKTICHHDSLRIICKILSALPTHLDWKSVAQCAYFESIVLIGVYPGAVFWTITFCPEEEKQRLFIYFFYFSMWNCSLCWERSSYIEKGEIKDIFEILSCWAF